MAIVSSEILKTHDRGGGRIFVIEKHIDDQGQLWDVRYNTHVSVDINANLAANAVRLEAEAADREAEAGAQMARKNLDRTPVYQTQAEFDRRVLSTLMRNPNPEAVANALPWFRRFEIRAGANANARATYLGVPRSEYDLVASRFNALQGLADGLANDQASVWNNVPEGWE